MDHNLLLKKSFRKSENKTIISVEQQSNTGVDRFVLRFLYQKRLDTHTHTHTQTNKQTHRRTPLNERLALSRGYYPPNTTNAIDENPCCQRYSISAISNQAASDTNPRPFGCRGRRTLIYSSAFHRLDVLQSVPCHVTRSSCCPSCICTKSYGFTNSALVLYF